MTFRCYTDLGANNCILTKVVLCILLKYESIIDKGLGLALVHHIGVFVNSNYLCCAGSPWVLSADSTGEEMQLTPGQGRLLNVLVYYY